MNGEVIDIIKNNINNYFNSLKETEMFNGAILVSIKGKKVISKGYGMANYELDVPNTCETKFRIGSITKQFTAVSIIQLYEKKLLNLNDKLNKYIKDYPNGENITIHHLLTHSSGIFNYDTFEEQMYVNNKYTTEKIIDNKIKYKPCEFKPGVKFSYIDSGYIILGYIIEKVSNVSYEQYLKDNIFSVLSMDNSGYYNRYSIIKNRASGYKRVEGNDIVNCDFLDTAISHGAGGLYSTVEDLSIWNNALLNSKIISNQSLEKILEKYIKVEENDYYGYGLHISDDRIKNKMIRKIWHKGGRPGFKSYNEVFPQNNIEIIAMTNINNNTFNQNIRQVENIIFEHVN